MIGGKGGPFVLAAVAGAVGIGAWFLPQKEQYSSDGFGLFGNVEIDCGSAGSERLNVDFDDQYEEDAYWSEVYTYGEPYIFEGKTASQVCDESIKNAKTVGFVAGGASALLFLVGFVRVSKKERDAFQQITPGAAAPPPPPPPPPSMGGSLPPPPNPTAPPPPAMEWLPEPPMPRAAPERDELPTAQVNVVGRELVGEHDGHTIPRSAIPSVPDTIRFGDGSVVTLGRALYVGRDPVAAGDGATHRVQDHSVSKTHLGIVRRDGKVWVEDLHSTNGTVIRSGDGSSRALRGGVAELLEVGDVVEFGDQTCSLEVRR